MIDKQNLRINAIAAAMLAMSLGASSAIAASASAPLPVKEPGRSAPADAVTSNRILVRYNAGTAAASDRSAKLSTVQSAVGRASLGGSNGISRAAAASVRAEYVRTLGIGADLIRLTGKLSKTDLDKVVAEIAADPTVKYAQVDAKLRPVDVLRAKTQVQPQLVPNDPLYAQYQWHYSNATGGINLPAAWDVSKGDGVVVAVLDTGILPNHPDVAVNLLQGYDFISDKEVSRRPTDARVPGALDYGDWVENDNECYAGSVAEDSSWHGSHVAGTVAEATNNGIGMAGVAPNATVLPVRVLGKCGGYTSDIADAITWASGGTVSGVPTNQNPAEVINMSLGGSGTCSSTYQNAINGAVSRGTTVVVAAGNSSTNVSSSVPANCNNVIAVAATTSSRAKASYSNYGAGIDISAPGSNILSTLNDGTTTPGNPSYASYNGTSMATPHVAGVVALMQSVAPTALTPAQVESTIKNTAASFSCSQGCGAGLLDANAAVTAALNGGSSGGGGGGGSSNELQDGVAVTNLSANSGSSLNYTVKVPSGASSLVVTTSGGSGDADLYVRFGSAPTDSAYDCRPYKNGNNESCTFNSPQAGTYYVRVKAYSTFSGVSLKADY